MFGSGLLDGDPTPKRGKWDTGLMLEDKSGDHPHVLITTAHNCRLESPDAILLGELAAMITILRNRMRQECFRDETVFPVSLVILALL